MSTNSRKIELFDEAIALEKRKRVKECLPHLFGYPPYQWTLDYWNSANRMKFLCAANQVGKSITQIRHVVDLATDPQKWRRYFPRRRPQAFWYIYPDGPTLDEEFSQKWVKETLPRAEMAGNPRYGWQTINKGGRLVGIEFNSGMRVSFKTWRQDLQASTLDGAFADEELPFDLYDELAQRLTNFDGMFSMVFTATLGQKEWYDTIELRGKHGEKFPDAFKRQISIEHDCKYYADGSPSPFTDEEVARRKALCSSEREVDRRVHGRFVSDSGLTYPSFQRSKNVKPKASINPRWYFFGGVDVGTGGREAHPAAISIITVRPDFRYGRLIRFWKGNRVETTNSTQILNQYIEMTKDLPMTGNFYDWQAKEFFLRAQSAGVPFQKANKERDFGIDLLNTLFRNEMLDIEEGKYIDDLCYEFENLKKSTSKTKAEDDGADSLRYASSTVGWDFSGVTSIFEKIEKPKEVWDKRKSRYDPRLYKKTVNDEYNVEHDIDDFNDLLHGGFDDGF